MKIYLLLLQIYGVYTGIVPDELPSLLSVVYSNIPTIKKGTDSRIGWGFRLGNRADFQFLIEIGPQLNTQPLKQPPSLGSSKRNVVHNLENTLYAQQFHNKQVLNGTRTHWIEQWGIQNQRGDFLNNEKENSTLTDQIYILGIFLSLAYVINSYM